MSGAIGGGRKEAEQEPVGIQGKESNPISIGQAREGAAAAADEHEGHVPALAASGHLRSVSQSPTVA